MSQSPNQITAHNAGWPSQFRYRGSRREPAVAQLSTLSALHLMKNTSTSLSRRKAFMVAAFIFAIDGFVMMIHGLSQGWGDFLEGVAVFGLSYLAFRESRKDDHVA